MLPFISRKHVKIISGGQTGVDQAALRAAQQCGIETGGWCPPGRISESGIIPDRFSLTETPEERSTKVPDIPRSLRTEWNVRDSDATLVLRQLLPVELPDKGVGTLWTLECAILYGKPLLVCDPNDPGGKKAQMVREWIKAQEVEILNVAGPSESSQPGIGQMAEAFMQAVLSPILFESVAKPA